MLKQHFETDVNVNKEQRTCEMFALPFMDGQVLRSFSHFCILLLLASVVFTKLVAKTFSCGTKFKSMVAMSKSDRRPALF